MPACEPSNIILKLLREDNVILAKCDGMETEVFMPAIVEGRISIMNIIPQRRCSCIATTHLVGRKKQRGQATASPSDTLHNWHVSLSSNQSNQKRKGTAPLANSTPTLLKSGSHGHSGVLKKSSHINNAYKSGNKDKTTSMTYPTPEPIRRALLETGNVTFLPPVMRSVNKPLSFDNCENISPDIVERSIASASPNPSVINNETPAKNLTGISWPRTPPSFRYRTNNGDNTIDVTLPLDFQCLKVKTPVRTYARNSHKLNRTFLPLIQHRLESTTQPPKTDKAIVCKKNKLIVDPKMYISPRSFRQQLKTESLSIQREEHREKLKISLSSMSRIPAFDLLTNITHRSSCIAKDLHNQFKKRCVNKASSTYPKYKKLCEVEPLEVKSNFSTRVLNALPEVNAKNTSELDVTPSIAADPNIENVYRLKLPISAATAVTTSKFPIVYKLNGMSIASMSPEGASEESLLPLPYADV